MPAAEHKLGVVSYLSVLVRKRLDNRTVGVVNEHHYVRKLDSRSASYGNAWRYSLNDSCLGCAYECVCALFVVVLFKVDRKHDATAHVSVRLSSFNVYHGVLVLDENAAKVLIHSCVYFGYARFGFAKIYLRENEAKRRGSVANLALCALPVFGLACELVAGNDSPFFCICFGHVGQKNVCRSKASFHFFNSFQLELCIEALYLSQARLS